jgi:hypothetical protein
MTILNRDTLAIIMVGTTHVIDMGGKNAFVHYETADRAHMLLPDGTRFHGAWTLLDDGYKVEWKDGPTGAWKLDHTPGGRSTMSTQPAPPADAFHASISATRSAWPLDPTAVSHQAGRRRSPVPANRSRRRASRR